MTKQLFFDTDCISAFLWVQEQSIVAKLYPGRIKIPRETYNELSIPTIRHLKDRIDILIKEGNAEIIDIPIDDEAYSIFYQLTEKPSNGHPIIGKGEAACLALAKTNNGIIASNNLLDIYDYVTELKIEHITTGDILIDAMNANLISEDEANYIWQKMLKKRRRLGADTFSGYLRMKEQLKK